MFLIEVSEATSLLPFHYGILKTKQYITNVRHHYYHTNRIKITKFPKSACYPNQVINNHFSGFVPDSLSSNFSIAMLAIK